MASWAPIVESYEQFYLKFLRVAGRVGAHPRYLAMDTRPDNGRYTSTLRTPIHLPDWTAEHGKPSNRVDIALTAEFTWSFPEGQHTSSTVTVTYLQKDIQNHKYVPIENLRFDYHPSVDGPSHPLFHAHVFSSRSVPMGLRSGWPIDWGGVSERMRAIRLPVPSMTLPAVLCFLVACHLGPIEMTYLLKDASKLLSSMPGFSLSQQQQDALSYNCLAGDNWYRRP